MLESKYNAMSSDSQTSYFSLTDQHQPWINWVLLIILFQFGWKKIYVITEKFYNCANQLHIPSSQRKISKMEIQNKDFSCLKSCLCVDITSLGWFPLYLKLWFFSTYCYVPISYSSPLHKVFLWHLNYF